MLLCPSSAVTTLNQEQGPVVNDFIDWCKSSFSNINVAKTKEICIDPTVISPVVMDYHAVELVSSTNNFGTLTNNKLRFELQVDAVCQKAHQLVHSKALRLCRHFYEWMHFMNFYFVFSWKRFIPVLLNRFLPSPLSAGTGHLLLNRKVVCKVLWRCAAKLLSHPCMTSMTWISLALKEIENSRLHLHPDAEQEAKKVNYPCCYQPCNYSLCCICWCIYFLFSEIYLLVLGVPLRDNKVTLNLEVNSGLSLRS